MITRTFDKITAVFVENGVEQRQEFVGVPINRVKTIIKRDHPEATGLNFMYDSVQRVMSEETFIENSEIKE